MEKHDTDTVVHICPLHTFARYTMRQLYFPRWWYQDVLKQWVRCHRMHKAADIDSIQRFYKLYLKLVDSGKRDCSLFVYLVIYLPQTEDY